ncbi:MAG: GGDEF domain-containing protein [Pirellulales bacterium]|nr:GGDEF domain-containing protein [Pirellulales bacterium]
MNDPRTDSQTGLPSRAAFYEDLHRRLAQSHRFGTRLSALLLKIDQLAEFVEDRGITADLVMRAYSQFVRADVRDMDLVARFDADTFGLMLPATELVYAATVGERVRRNAEANPIPLPIGRIGLTLSVGVAEAQKGDDAAAFIERSVAALQVALVDGGNTVRFHTGISIESLPTARSACIS